MACFCSLRIQCCGTMKYGMPPFLASALPACLLQDAAHDWMIVCVYACCFYEIQIKLTSLVREFVVTRLMFKLKAYICYSFWTAFTLHFNLAIMSFNLLLQQRTPWKAF